MSNALEVAQNALSTGSRSIFTLPSASELIELLVEGIVGASTSSATDLNQSATDLNQSATEISSACIKESI